MEERELTKIAARVYELVEERKKREREGKILATRRWLENRYGSTPIRALIKLRLIFPYSFGMEEMEDPDGNVVVRKKGVDYYRVSDVERALEDFNNYKSIKEHYRKRTMAMRELVRELKERLSSAI